MNTECRVRQANRISYVLALVYFACCSIARADQISAFREWNSIVIGLTVDGQEDAGTIYASSSGGKLKELRNQINLPNNRINLVFPQDLLIGIYSPQLDSISIEGIPFDGPALLLDFGLSMHFGDQVPDPDMRCSNGHPPLEFWLARFYIDMERKVFGREIYSYCDYVDKREVEFD